MLLWEKVMTFMSQNRVKWRERGRKRLTLLFCFIFLPPFHILFPHFAGLSELVSIHQMKQPPLLVLKVVEGVQRPVSVPQREILAPRFRLTGGQTLRQLAPALFLHGAVGVTSVGVQSQVFWGFVPEV